MSDIILGARIELKTDGVTQGASAASNSFRSIGNAAKQAQAQLDALNKQAQQTQRAYVGIGASLGMYQKTIVDTGKAWAELSRIGARQFDGTQMANKMAASAKATNEAFASIYKNAERTGQGYFGKLQTLFDQTALGQKLLAFEAEKSSKRMVAANEKVGLSFRGWLPHIRTAAASIGIYLGVRAIANIVKMADSFTEMGARLRLVSGNVQELTRAQEGLFKIAQSNRAPLQDVVNLYFKLGNSMRDLGASQKDVLQTVDTVGKAMRVSGASTIEISAAMQQLAQAFAKGKLDGDEFRSTMENAPRLMRALTDEFGISKEELYKWSETGKLSVQKLMQAIKNQSGEIEKEFETIPVTISGAWQQLENAVTNYIGRADQANESSKGLAQTMSDLAQNVDPLLDFFGAIAKVEIGGLAAIAKYFAEIRDTLRELFDLQGGFTPMSEDLKRIVQMGRGQVPIDQLARGRPEAGYTALSTARNYLGFSETNKKQELTDYLNQYSGTVFKDIAGEVNAWCARFVSAVLQQNGIQNPQTASARAFAQFGQSVWKRGDGNQGLENVKPGDIVVFTRGKGGHVAFVDSVDMQKGTFRALGGNQGNAVSIRERSFSDPTLMAIRRIGGTGDFFSGRNTQVEKLNAALVALTDIQKMIVQKSIAAGLDPTLMLALAQRESNFDPNRPADPRLVRGRGPEKTGLGLYQFIPSTGEKYGLMNDADRKNAEKATDAAIAFFKDLLISFKGDMTKALAAWNMGEPNVRRRLAQGQDPQQFTEGPHVQRILEYRKQWEAKLRGALPNIMGAGDIEKQNKAFDAVLNDQFESFSKHLKRLEDERSAYNTVDLAQQRTAMEKLEAQREQMRKADEAAMAVAQGSGNMEAVRQANVTAAEHEIKFLKEKNTLLLEGMDLEYKAMSARKGEIGRQIAEAQKTKGSEALAQIPDLRSEAKQLDAQMKALVEQRKQIEVKGAAEITAATQKAEDDKRKAYRETADIAVEVEKNRREAAQVELDQAKQRAGDFVAMERNRIEGLQAEYAIQKELAGISAEAFSQYAEQQRGAIDVSLERAKAEFENRDAQRQALLEGKEGISAIIQARENLNDRLQDQLNLLQQERDATVQKLDLSRQELEYQKRIAEWKVQKTIETDANDLLAQLSAKKELAAVEAQIAQNLQEQAKANETLSREQAKAQGDAERKKQELEAQLRKNNETMVREQRLRENAYWDQLIGRMRQFQETWQKITGEDSNPFADLAVQVNEMVKNIEQLGNSYENMQEGWRAHMMATSEEFRQMSAEAAKSGKTLANPILDVAEGLGVAQQAIHMMAQTMLAIRSQYAEGTKGYEDMTAAAERMMEVQRALQLVEAVLGVVHQASAGDVYSVVPRMLAVGALMASMGLNTGVAGGSSGMSNRQARNSSQVGGSPSAGGGVFGDTGAKSESIAKALEIVAQNSSVDLAYSAGMLRALTNIELALKGTTNAIIRGVAPQAVAGLGTRSLDQIINPLNGISDPLTKFIHKLVFNVSTKISDWGIKALPQSLDQVIANGFQGMNWTEVTKTTKILGITVGKSVKNLYSDLDAGVSGQITRVIRSMADTVREAGKAFGISGDQFNAAMRGFVVSFGQLSTKGLKSDELQKAVQQVFSSMSDDMAQQFQSRFNLNLEPFMRAGEGMFETLVRVADGINVATGMLEQAGLKAVNYQEIVLKQGDVAAEIVRQSIIAYEGIFGTIGKYLDGAVGSAQESIAVYQDLLSIRAMSATVGLSFRDLSNDMIVAAGGVAALKDSISFYLENFIGAGGVAAAKATELADSFRRLGMRVPESQEAFRKLVEGIDQSTVAGQKLWAQMLKLAPAFLEAKQAAQELADLRTKLKGGNPFAELDSQWKQLWKDWGTVMDGELALVGGPFEAKIKAQQDAIQGWVQAISAGTASIGLLTGELVRLSIAKAPASTLKSIEQAIVTLTANLGAWQKKIKEANAAIEALKADQSAAAAAKRQEILQEQGWSLIGSIADMWEKMISGIRSSVASMQDQIDQLSPNSSQAVYNTASGRVTEAYANLSGYRERMAGMGQATDPTVELGYITNIQSAVMARYNAELALLQEAQQAMVEAETERLNAELDAFIEARNNALDAEIEAINDALDVEIEAINDALDARIKAQQDLDEAAIKSLQKKFDAENKALQKQFDAAIKSRQKEYDAANKLTQRQFDKERQALQKAQDARMKVLTDELDAANRLAEAIKSIADYAQSMKLGASSPLSPEARMTEAQRQYQGLLAKANAGDADAMAKLAGASDAYLEAARAYYGSSTNYEDIFAGVQQAMESIGGMSAPDPNSIQARIEALQETLEAEMQALQDQQEAIMDTIRETQQEAIDALRETQQEQLDAIRDGQQGQIDAVREAQQDVIDALREAAQDQIDAARKAAQDQIDAARKVAEAAIEAERKGTQQKIADLSDPEKNAAIKALKERVVDELKALQQQAADLEEKARAKADAWINEVRAWMTQNQMNDAAMLAALNGLAAAISGRAAIPTTPNPGPLPGYASGGQASPGYAIVGEQGPELVRFNRPGQVYAASETRQMLTGSDEETKGILREIKTETKASVTVQSTAFQRMIDKLNSMDDRLNAMERTQRLKA